MRNRYRPAYVATLFAWALVLATLIVLLAPRAVATGEEVTTPAPVPDERWVDWPTEVVVPVLATPAVAEIAAPTAASGAELAWPRLILGETGTVSTYGPGFAGYLALPWPYCGGWRVLIAGPGGKVERVSNDCGPERRLRRIADLDVATFEAVCGVSWRMGLCTATVMVTGRAE